MATAEERAQEKWKEANNAWLEVDYIARLEGQREALLPALIYARSIVAKAHGEDSAFLVLIDKAIAKGENQTEPLK